MRILITNDDGIHAPGLRALAEAAAKIGEVKVSAPDRQRSACGHAMTMRDPLRVKKAHWKGIEAWEVNGLPVDCVNVGLTHLWPDGCDLVLSGINSGPNLGFDVTYSGTCGGAMEGCVNGIRSIALSSAILNGGETIDYDSSREWIEAHWDLLLKAPLPPISFLNVNIPALPFAQLKGYRFAAMGRRVYEDRVERREDPWGEPYFWQGGVNIMDRTLPDTDFHAVCQGFVAITPITIDWTSYEGLAALEKWRTGE